MPQKKYEEQFTDIFLFLITIKCFITYKALQIIYLLPLNFDLIFASSLLTRRISLSLLLQFRISEIKTAKPRMASPFVLGIFKKT